MSPNGLVLLAMQTDGNVVLYNQQNSTPLWATGTSQAPRELAMQEDGNLVLYGGAGLSSVLWRSNTQGHDGAHAEVHDSGNLTVSAAQHTLWQTNTSILPHGHVGLDPLGYGPERDYDLDVSQCYRLQRKTGVVLALTPFFDTSWEVVIIAYSFASPDPDANDIWFERGNFGRDTSQAAVTPPADILISAWYKRSAPAANAAWWQAQFADHTTSMGTGGPGGSTTTTKYDLQFFENPSRILARIVGEAP